MDRTAAERAQLLRDWQAEPRNRDLTPPVEVAPPGARARRRATLAQKKAVQETLRRHDQEMLQLSERHVRALGPVMVQAQKELGRQLQQWVQRVPDGSLRWTAWKYRAAVLQLQSGVAALEQSMRTRLTRAGAEAQRLSIDHMVSEVARFSSVFGDQLPPVRVNMAALVAAGEASLVPHYRAAAERYAWGRKNGVWADLNQRLAVDILKGSSVAETVDRVVEHGGPRGVVALSGIAGEEDAVIELIPEGLFKRYRWKAETYVRTELASAYGLQSRLAFESFRQALPDLQRRWCTDGSGCPHICEPMDGQTVAADESFIDGEGHVVDHDGGAHPNCRCRWCAWRPHWDALFSSLGIS